MSYIPKSKPKLKKAEALKIVKHYYGDDPVPNLILIGIRGYYSHTMGPTKGNDINLYDDAMVMLGSEVYQTYNANTDPSFVKKGGRKLAMLNPGKYKFAKGRHKGQYNALRAYPEGVVLPCTRDGEPATCSYINIHKGGINPSSAGVTWSAGCTTIPLGQWNSFIEPVYSQMLKHGMKTVDYLLISVQDMDKILNS